MFSLPEYPILFVTGLSASTCRFPGAPAHSRVSFSDETMNEGTVATYECERGFELLGPTRRACEANGKWIPDGIPFCGKLILNVLVRWLSRILIEP